MGEEQIEVKLVMTYGPDRTFMDLWSHVVHKVGDVDLLEAVPYLIKKIVKGHKEIDRLLGFVFSSLIQSRITIIEVVSICKDIHEAYPGYRPDSYWIRDILMRVSRHWEDKIVGDDLEQVSALINLFDLNESDLEVQEETRYYEEEGESRVEEYCKYPDCLPPFKALKW